MLALARKTDLADQARTAEAMYGRLQKRAMTLPGTTQEYVDMAGKITRVVIDAGGTVKDLEDMTVSATVAAKGLGENWEVAARDIEQALMGRYNTTDPFSSKVLGSIGYKGEEGRDKWRALSADKRLEEMKRALGQKQFAQLGEAMGGTFEGVMSTLQENFTQIIGKVGLPLFKALTAEVKSWNKWLDANSDKVDEIAKSIGEGLVKGFSLVKDALGLIVSHADLLITIGKVWAAVKIGGMIGGLAGKGQGVLGALGEKAGWFKGASDSFGENGYQYSPGGAGRQGVGGLKGVIGNAGLLAQSAALGYTVGSLINDATGLSHAISGSVEVNGKLYDATDRTTQRFVMLERESSALGDAINKAKKAADGFGGQTLGNLIGQQSLYAQQEQAIRAHLAAQGVASGGTGNSILDAGMNLAGKAAGIGDVSSATARMSGTGAKLEGLGLDPKQVGQEMADELAAKQAELGALVTGTGMGTMAAMAIGVRQLTDYQRQTLDTAKAQEEVLTYIQGHLAQGIQIDPADIMKILRENTADPTGTHKAIGDKPKVNVTIQRIEVQSDDPDRMAFGMIEAFRDAAKNPSSALAALREG
jgi:hypothetical protein